MNPFHMHCLCCILGISWSKKITIKDVLSWAKTASFMKTLKMQGLTGWPHVPHGRDRWLPKDILYGELWSGNQSAGLPLMHFTEGHRSCGMDINQWKCLVQECAAWGHKVHSCLKRGQENTSARQRRNVVAENKHRKVTDQGKHSHVTCALGNATHGLNCKQQNQLLRVPILWS